MKNFSSTEFKDDLENSLVDYMNGLQTIVDENNNFYDKYIGVLYKHAPYKNLTRKQTKLADKP